MQQACACSPSQACESEGSSGGALTKAQPDHKGRACQRGPSSCFISRSLSVARGGRPHVPRAQRLCSLCACVSSSECHALVWLKMAGSMGTALATGKRECSGATDLFAPAASDLQASPQVPNPGLREQRLPAPRDRCPRKAEGPRDSLHANYAESVRHPGLHVLGRGCVVSGVIGKCQNRKHRTEMAFRQLSARQQRHGLSVRPGCFSLFSALRPEGC